MACYRVNFTSVTTRKTGTRIGSKDGREVLAKGLNYGVLLTVHLSIILVINQLDAQILVL